MDIEEVEVEKPPIVRFEALRAFLVVKQYVEENFDDPAVLSLSDALDEAFYKDRQKKLKQPQITDFSNLTVEFCLLLWFIDVD